MDENRWVTPADSMRPRANASSSSGRVLAFGVLFTIAIASIAGGVLLDRYVLLPRIFHMGPPGRGGGPAGMMGDRGGRRGPERGRQAFHDRLADDLGLTSTQRVQMDSLMDAQERELRAAHESVQPRIDSIVSDTRAKLDALLSAEQRQKLDSLRARGSFGPPPGRGRRRGPGPGFGPGEGGMPPAQPPSNSSAGTPRR